MNKGFVGILVLIVLAAAAVAGAYYWGTQKSGGTPLVIQSPSSSPASTPDETANWKTYASTKYGYSIKYPEFLQYSTRTYNGIGGIVTIDEWSNSNKSYVISIFSYADGVNTKLEFNAETKSDETTLVGGQQVRKVVATETISDQGTLIHIGPIKNKGQNYMFIYTSGSQKANPEDLALFNQILSTFEFID